MFNFNFIVTQKMGYFLPIGLEKILNDNTQDL